MGCGSSTDGGHDEGAAPTATPAAAAPAADVPAAAAPADIDPFALVADITHQEKLLAVLKKAAGADGKMTEISKRQLVKLFHDGGFQAMLEEAGVVDMFDKEHNGVQRVNEIIEALDENHDGTVSTEEAFKLISENVWAKAGMIDLASLVKEEEAAPPAGSGPAASAVAATDPDE